MMSWFLRIRICFFCVFFVIPAVAISKKDCLVAQCSRKHLAPKMFLPPIKQYRLNITIIGAKMNTRIFLNGEKYGETSSKGNFKYSTPLHEAGKLCLEVGGRSHRFSLKDDLDLICIGKELCCSYSSVK